MKLCNNNKQKRIIFYKNIEPIISIISPIYNREKNLFRFIKSVQNQNFFNLELILVDDNSYDNSIKIIEKYERNDQRIKLIKNKKNKGTLITRNLGILFSMGKYIILPDPDDIISKNILNICYKLSKKYQYEMIRFNCYIGKGKLAYNKIYNNILKKTIYQPELTKFLYYGKGDLQRIDGMLHNKFIKKQVFIKALNLLNKFYLNLHMIYLEDVLITHILYIVSNSFFFLKKIGYFYLRSSQSITKNLIYNLEIKAFFIGLKLIFEYYKKTKKEMDIINYILMRFQILKNNFRFFLIENIKYNYNDSLILKLDIINNYLNCKFITNENRNLLNNINKYLKKIGLKIKNNGK